MTNKPRRVLVLMAHPSLRHSIVNKRLIDVVHALDDVTFVDLYSLYPRFKIDVQREQERLLAHDCIILQFPLMWYSTPSILKEWQDLVLEHGFAYGEGGDKLAGKILFPIVSAGASSHAYTLEGHNQVTLRTLLSPLEATARLCQLRYVPPYVLFSSLAAEEDDTLGPHVNSYRLLLSSLSGGHLELEPLLAHEHLTADIVSDLSIDPAGAHT